MTWNNLVAPHAITSRRRVVASALMYGLSLTVRFTSPVRETAEVPPQAIVNDAAQIIRMASPSRPAPAYLGWPVASGCRTAR
ncbi:hypothetical protein IVA98_27930 [Bradyrhizobium sp. 160]|jgi:hypothetical protein|uniref:hypothetical protein n=1 Tax=Bradyrhizobium sp. 160 TaxID=2782634 RepID=UPI001FF7A18C|nr:hypothetical protein [Bradyrhizobium sp. 160]MCK1626888.1 hypothetical protein [Bradyrhizobium sp. 160]